MSKLLYIGGYGRSGSTVLATVLGSHPEMESVGEVCFLHDDWGEDARQCSCGRRYAACDLWGSLGLDRQSGSDAALVRRVESIRGFPRVLGGLIPTHERGRYAAYQRRLLGHVRRQSGKPVVVDSSKSAWLAAARALALDRLVGEEVYLIHLVRDGRATLESLLGTGSNWQLEGHAARTALPGLRAVTGWLGANLIAALTGARLGRGRYLRVRYEDLLRDPEGELGRIGRLIGLDVTQLIARIRNGDPFPVGHMVGGNRDRLQREITVAPSRSRPRSVRLKLRHRLLFALSGGWLNARYGYGGF